MDAQLLNPLPWKQRLLYQEKGLQSAAVYPARIGIRNLPNSFVPRNTSHWCISNIQGASTQLLSDSTRRYECGNASAEPTKL